MNKLTPTDGRIAIIDIGSNSIRLVVYDQQKRAPVPIYNEKVMCGLGKGLATSGLLNPEGVVLAKDALRRFVAMARGMHISALHVMATAAVRDAKDGPEFARWLESHYGVAIDIISGEEEARLGAYAVCSSMYRPHGISADLGGGSIELVRVDEGRIGSRASLPLGSLRMLDETKGDREKLRKLVDKRIAEIDWLNSEKAEQVYAIGGSFRALAKMHMVACDYPLQILHEYTVDAKSFVNFLRDVAMLSNDKLEKFPGGAPKRAAALPGAAMVLETILAKSRAERVVFSASGIREGYIYDKLSPKQKGEDDLLATCKEFSSRGRRSNEYAQELFDWMQPLLPTGDERERRLRMAFCLLSDIALHIHPEYRAAWAFQRIIYSAFTSLTHRERVTLALALYHRYQHKFKDVSPTLALITPADRNWAKLVGSCANLAYHLSGSMKGNLPRTTLLNRDGHVGLQFIGDMADVMGDAVQKRIDGVDEAFRAVTSN